MINLTLDIQEFKELLTHKMKSTFESTGEVGPIVFFLRRDENVMIGKIPPGAMSSIEGKYHLADNIREICRDPITMAAALLAEVNIRDNEKYPAIETMSARRVPRIFNIVFIGTS